MNLVHLLCLLNLTLVVLIGARLELHKTSIFTFGFFSVGAALLPHYVLMPLYHLA
jgi:hypothetical protein